MRGRRKGSRGKRGGRGSASVGTRGRKITISKDQKTLMDYYGQKATEQKPPPPKIEEEVPEEPEQNPYSEMEQKLISLVKKHQLNEVISNFQMADRFLLHFSIAEMKYFYKVVQHEMIEEFGAPLSPSLFPRMLFDENELCEDNHEQSSSSSRSLF